MRGSKGSGEGRLTGGRPLHRVEGSKSGRISEYRLLEGLCGGDLSCRECCDIASRDGEVGGGGDIISRCGAGDIMSR